MAGIGGIECDYVKGEVAALKPRVRTWTAPGIIGYGAHVTAKGNSNFEFVGVLFDNPLTVKNWGALIEQLQGSVISIVDDWEVQHLQLLVVQVGPLFRSAALGHDPFVGWTGARGQITVRGVKIDG